MCGMRTELVQHQHGDVSPAEQCMRDMHFEMQVMRALGNDDGAALRSLAEILATCTPHHPHAQIRPRPPADITPWQVPPARTPSAAVPASPPATPAATAAAAAAAAEAAAAARAQQRRSAAVRHSGAQNNGIDESAGRLLFSSADGSGSGSSSGGGSWRWHWDADAPEHDGLTAAEVGLFSSSASIGARINTDAIRGKVVRIYLMHQRRTHTPAHQPSICCERCVRLSYSPPRCPYSACRQVL